MSVIEPDLPSGMQGILRNAHDDTGLPIRQTCQIAGIRGDDTRDTDVRAREDIDPLVAMTDPERIAPEKTDEPVGGEVKRGRSAPGPGRQLPVRMRSGIIHPGAKGK